MLENCTDDYTDEPGSLNTDTNPKYINTEGEMIQKDKEIIIEKMKIHLSFKIGFKQIFKN